MNCLKLNELTFNILRDLLTLPVKSKTLNLLNIRHYMTSKGFVFEVGEWRQ